MAASFTLTEIQAADVTGAALPHSRIDVQALTRSALAILDETALCSIATVRPDGRAHVNTAYFAYTDGLELVFLSHPESVHCRNLLWNPTAAVTVFSSAQQWAGDDRGLQLFGDCKPASGAQAARAEQVYRSRFPEYDAWQAAIGEDSLSRAYRFYRLEVASVRVLDEKHFGDGVFVRAEVRRG